MWNSFEALLGRRYLMRAHRRPRVWYIGLAILALGSLMAISAGAIQSNPSWAGALTKAFNLGGGDPLYAQAHLVQLSQVIQGLGLGFVVIGVSVSLFGFLVWWMTTFSAFSTFMIATGVAEVLLVLGVMNGFQGYLRSKLIDAHAHVSVLPVQGEEWLTNYRALSDEVSSISGAEGVSPVLNTEVMLRVPSQEVTAAARLMGIDSQNIDQTVKLSKFLSEGCGCLSTLVDPKPFNQLFASDPLASMSYCSKGCPEIDQSSLPLGADSMSNLDVKGQGRRDRDQIKEASSQELMMALPPPKRAGVTPSLILGVHLRYNLGLSLGQPIEIISPLGDIGPHGPMPKVKPFQLTGWVTSGLVEIDSQQVYASLADAQRFIGVGDVVNELRVRAKSIEDARGLRDRLRVALKGRAQVIDWRERNKNLFSALQLERIAMFLVLTINILLAAFSITSTLVMSLIERRREISILRAIGAESRSMMWIFISQGLTAGGVGSLLGVLIGGSACALLASFGLPLNAEEVYYISSIPVEVKAYDLIAILFVAISVSALSTIYPAIYAARIQPVEGIKGQ